MPGEDHDLKVKLALKWVQANRYEADATVTVTDSRYREGDFRIGMPRGMKGVPGILYLVFAFTHEGEACDPIVRDVSKSIIVPITSCVRDVAAYVLVNGKAAGCDVARVPEAL